MGSHRQDGRDDVTMKVVVIVLSMSVIATAFTIDDPRLPLRRQRRHPGLFSELLDYGFLDIFQDPNDASSSYSAPSYEVPESTYSAPETYEVPQASSYVAPQSPNYDAPESTYEVPEPTYSAPETYEVPQATSYVAPQSPNYDAPESTYNEPEEPILEINIGVGNEAIIARKKREPGLLDGLADLFKDPSDASSSYSAPSY